MLPPAVPYRIEIIFLTGVLEILGAIGVWIAPLMRLTGFCLILMLICFLPANIYSALNHVDFGGLWRRSGLFTLPSSFPALRSLVDVLRDAKRVAIIHAK
jgi:uncharacterized membrane protein